ncbi:MAG: sulfatase [Candidatus Binatia bacterium]|nr:sulfatase [Candidatus Binatia bacterium]
MQHSHLMWRGWRGVGTGWAAASLCVGLVDVLVCLWANREIGPERALAPALAAPMLLAAGALAGPAFLIGLLRGLRGRSDSVANGASATTALLLALVTGVLAWRLGGVVLDAWVDGGHRARASVGAWALMAFILPSALWVAGVLRPALGRLAPLSWRRLARVSWALQALAVAASVVLVEYEGPGLLRDLLGPVALARAPADPHGAAPNRPPNLVLLTIDTLRADRLSAEIMPRTTNLARGGVRFTQAFAAAPWTLPSLASVHTGRSARGHGAGRSVGVDPLARSALGPDVPVLAEALREQGFTTRAVVTNPYLSIEYGLGRGFDTYENVSLETEAWLLLEPTIAGWFWARALPRFWIVDRGPTVTSRAVRFLRSVDASQPFFLWLHYLDPHAPYDGETRSFRGELLAPSKTNGRLPSMARLRAGEIRPDAVGRQRLEAAYDRAVGDADCEVGEVVDALGERGLSEQTLVVVTSDHGEEFWEHGGVEHGHTLYDEVLRVPLVLRGPGVHAGRVVERIVGLDRLAPTLLALLRVEVPAGMGTGFADVVSDGTAAAWASWPVRSENLLFAQERAALRTGGHTYVRWPSGKEEVYDRRSDPGELRDRAADAGLRRSLAARFDRAEPGAPRALKPISRAAGVRAALRALGYVQ